MEAAGVNQAFRQSDEALDEGDGGEGFPAKLPPESVGAGGGAGRRGGL